MIWSSTLNAQTYSGHSRLRLIPKFICCLYFLLLRTNASRLVAFVTTLCPLKCPPSSLLKPLIIKKIQITNYFSFKIGISTRIKLIDHITKDYRRTIRPVVNTSTITNVTLRVTFQNLINMVSISCLYHSPVRLIHFFKSFWAFSFRRKLIFFSLPLLNFYSWKMYHVVV